MTATWRLGNNRKRSANKNIAKALTADKAVVCALVKRLPYTTLKTAGIKIEKTVYNPSRKGGIFYAKNSFGSGNAADIDAC